jgi:hypothetical protein
MLYDSFVYIISSFQVPESATICSTERPRAANLDLSVAKVSVGRGMAPFAALALETRPSLRPVGTSHATFPPEVCSNIIITSTGKICQL